MGKRKLQTLSWASVTGHVDYWLGKKFETMAEVLSIDSTEIGSDQWRPLEPGRISLNGYMIPVQTSSGGD